MSGAPHKWKRQPKGRLKELVKYFAGQTDMKDYFTGKPITLEDLQKNKWTVHHKDENRKNNEPENLALTLRSEHDRFHRLNPKKKGGE